MANILFSLFSIILLSSVFSNNAFAKAQSTVKCGMAKGYPPFQFIENNMPTGFDYDVLKQVLSNSQQELMLKADLWDDTVNRLRFDKLDCITGMEISPEREKYFDFTVPYYFRYTSVFVRDELPSIEIVQDLYGKKISGDKHSITETIWQEKHIKDHFRLIQTQSKDQAMQMLATKQTDAAIMPRAVGLYLAKKYNVKVKIVHSNYRGTPVAIAVKKGNKALLDKLNSALKTLIRSEEINTILSDYQQP
ncbi:transporter substrate-binding domain-containing protein [Pseudoalteromonas sp. G4]|uniref:transporter substrate-binding domain-containing protein n=1 Tax=Pseudoalteromonas sp. G4 TaxID=2992761 RepID=UPI00237E7EEA|nr:transporter substrate-binding domain-containing protein [Pseudoalteromonas sp. G4]MDE3270419.1 transporter substrate-binding domain-containing protein [Pseudoalteromonas sp. G4]